jgi:hypothetical protein
MTNQETYHKLQKKYNLPKFEDINHDFEITAIDKTDFLLREIRKKISEKIELLAKLLEGVLQPETTLTHFKESNVFSEEEREIIYTLFRKLMFYDRFSIETSLNETDAKTADFLKTFWKDWTSIKTSLEKTIKKIKESWEEETEFKQELSYIR